jgi:uncharacterized protein YuzE
VELTIQTDLENDLMYLGFGTPFTEAGVVKKTVRVGEDIALDFDKDGRLLGLDVMNASENLGGPIDEVQLDFLVGVKEAAALVGVQRSNFVRDYADKADFPRPVTELATGRIWLRSQVEAYTRARRKRRAS